MQVDADVLKPMVKKLQLWRPLDVDEQAALLALPCQVVELSPHKYIVREQELTTRSCLLVSGFACRQKIAQHGARSILALHMGGDLVDLQNSLLEVADHSVQVLTDAVVAFIPREAIVDLALRYPNVGLAMWFDTLVDGSIAREWTVNVARRAGQVRIAHVICEFGIRLESLRLGSRDCYEFPLTQDQLADAVGLTPVHVNRMLRELERGGLIDRAGRTVRVADWARLAASADFRDTYLHLKHPGAGPVAPQLLPAG